MSHEEDEDPLKKEDFYLELQVSEEDEDLHTHGNSKDPTRCHKTMLQQDAIFAAWPACMQKTRSNLCSLRMTVFPAFLPATACLRDLVPASTV